MALPRMRKGEAEAQDNAPLVDPETLPEFEKVRAAAESAMQAANLITEITDQETANEAVEALRGLKHVRQDAERFRKECAGPYVDAKRRIDVAFRELASPIVAAEQSIKERFAAHERAKEAAAREEARKREEAAREAQRAEDEAAAAQKRMSHHVPPPAPAPPPVSGGRAPASGAKASVPRVRKYEITDEALLPDEYLIKTPDRRKIKAAVDAGLAVPGVRPYWDDTQVAIHG